MAYLDRFGGSCNPLDGPSDRISVLSNTKGKNLKLLNMITTINESKSLVKCSLCNCKCRFDGKKYISNKKRNNDKYGGECKSLWNNIHLKKL